MTMRHNTMFLQAIFLCGLLTFSQPAHAGTPISDRVAVEAGVKTEIRQRPVPTPHTSGDALRQNLP